MKKIIKISPDIESFYSTEDEDAWIIFNGVPTEEKISDVEPVYYQIKVLRTKLPQFLSFLSLLSSKDTSSMKGSTSGTTPATEPLDDNENLQFEVPEKEIQNFINNLSTKLFTNQTIPRAYDIEIIEHITISQPRKIQETIIPKGSCIKFFHKGLLTEDLL